MLEGVAQLKINTLRSVKKKNKQRPEDERQAMKLKNDHEDPDSVARVSAFRSDFLHFRRIFDESLLFVDANRHLPFVLS